MKKLNVILTSLMLFCLIISSCRSVQDDDRLSIVVTYAVLGAVVQDLVGTSARVTISVPNGQDPHEWDPSARDIEAINNADLVVQNGLGLEGGLEETLKEAERQGVKFFTASDYIDIRHVGPDEGIPSGDPDQQPGAPDPHLWFDPLAVKSVIIALAAKLKDDFKLDVASQAADLSSRLDQLNGSIASVVDTLPAGNRKLVTGHESLGYFARRYRFQLIGAVVPSLTSEAEVSAADLATLKRLIIENHVDVVFTELGTSAAIAAAVSNETGAKLVELNTHFLPPDSSYFTLMTELARTVTKALQ